MVYGSTVYVLKISIKVYKKIEKRGVDKLGKALVKMNLNLTNVAVYGEELRDRLSKTKPPLLKGRWQLFRSFPYTFVGSEVVEFMVKDLTMSQNERLSEETGNNNNKEDDGAAAASTGEVVTDSENATRILQTLTDFGIIHTVHGDNTGTFKNDASYYRFTADDGSSSGLVEALTKGRRVHQLTLCPNCALLQRVCEYGKFISDKCMRGSELITWIFEHKLASQRDDAYRLCKLMFEHGILKAVSSKVTEFTDGRPFYLFGIDYTTPTLSARTFLSLLNSNEPLIVPNTSKIANSQKPQHGRQSSGQLLDLSQANARNRARRKNTSSSSLASDDSGYNDLSSVTSSYTTTPPTYESLLKSDGKLSAEALRHPDAPFIRKELRIFPDAVGYGFIIRGGAPCYVKIVDPDSPAGKSGLRAWQYIAEVNDCDVTRKTHTEIENLILNGPKNLLLSLMVPKDEACYAHVREINQSNKCAQSDAQLPKAQVNANSALRRQSMPITPKAPKLPSAQPWMKQQRKGSDFGVLMQKPSLKYVH